MDSKSIEVGDVEIKPLDRAPQPDDEFMCSHCLSTFSVRDLTIVPSFDPGRGWSGAYRCPADRALAYEAARSAILFGGLTEDQLAQIFETLANWNLPPMTLRPFTAGESLESGLISILGLLERGVVRLNHGFVAPSDGTRRILLAIDALLACLIAPRGHAVDEALFPLLRSGEARAVILDFAVESAMFSLQPGDVVDTERWAELLRYADIKRSEDAPEGHPSPEEIAHWRDVVAGR